MLELFSQTDLVGSMSGWITAIGSVGLLGPVLYWICYVHLPSKDRQNNDMMNAKDTLIKNIVEAKDKQIRDLLTDFAAEREKDRVVRHDMSNQFQKAIGELQKEHDADLEKHDKRMDLITNAFRQENKETKEEFKGALKEVLAHCEKETASLITAFKAEMVRLISRNEGETKPPRPPRPDRQGSSQQ